MPRQERINKLDFAIFELSFLNDDQLCNEPANLRLIQILNPEKEL
jgi:hypothetical protein